MHLLPLAARSLAFALLGIAPTLIARAAEFPNAAQPQLAATAEGRVYLAFGRGQEIFVAHSDDGGVTFGQANKVATLPKLMLGMRRGPRIAAHGNRVTVTLIGQELFAFTSADGGKTWSDAATVNDVPASAREGLHDLTGAPDGRLFVTWLDLRSGKTELWGAFSQDGGRTWGKNEQVYRSPDTSICECCHPTALFDTGGNLAVMWRNSIEGTRDMWLSTRPNGANQFAAARKLGEGTWNLKGCPMDGGRIVAAGGGKFWSVWQRAGEVFLTRAEGGEVSLGQGKQPIVISNGGQAFVFWQRGTDLVSVRDLRDAEPVKLASDARFATAVALKDGRGAILAYEQGAAKEPRIVIERL
ncbi:MAG: exo-alpha-sialidase [Opitutaceae bacterium]|nr:exo-alpha-sialidase [Opitutaceae bacterium]